MKRKKTRRYRYTNKKFQWALSGSENKALSWAHRKNLFVDFFKNLDSGSERLLSPVAASIIILNLCSVNQRLSRTNRKLWSICDYLFDICESVSLDLYRDEAQLYQLQRSVRSTEESVFWTKKRLLNHAICMTKVLFSGYHNPGGIWNFNQDSLRVY